MSRARILVSRALLSKYRKMSRPQNPCHGHNLGFLSRALKKMSRPLFLVQKCHGLFFDVTGIFAKNITGTQKKMSRTLFFSPKLSRAFFRCNGHFRENCLGHSKTCHGHFFWSKIVTAVFSMSRAFWRKLSRARKKMSRVKKKHCTAQAKKIMKSDCFRGLRSNFYSTLL